MISRNYSSCVMIIIIICLRTVIWFQVFLSNTNNSYTVIWFQVFLSITNNYKVSKISYLILFMQMSLINRWDPCRVSHSGWSGLRSNIYEGAFHTPKCSRSDTSSPDAVSFITRTLLFEGESLIAPQGLHSDVAVIVTKRLSTHRLYPWRWGKTPSPKKGVLSMTLICIWWWGYSSRGMWGTTFIAITTRFTLTRSDCTFQGPCFRSNRFVWKWSTFNWNESKTNPKNWSCLSFMAY